MTTSSSPPPSPPPCDDNPSPAPSVFSATPVYPPPPRRIAVAEGQARLLLLMLRGVFGWRFFMTAGFVAALLAVGVLLYLSRAPETIEPAWVHVRLGRLFALLTIILASPLLPEERSRGTLEILWLACGSFRRLLRMKLFALTLLIGACAIPAVLAIDWFFAGRLDVVKEVGFLVVQGILVGTWVFYVGSYLPQPWAGGLVAGATLLAFDWLLYPLGGLFNPFASLYGSDGQVLGWTPFLVNRGVTLGVVWLLFDQSSRRVRLWLA